MANEKFYLNCPYSEKDEAKALGAWWDTTKKKWYVPEEWMKHHLRDGFQIVICPQVMKNHLTGKVF